jgi:hypothetical protein
MASRHTGTGEHAKPGSGLPSASVIQQSPITVSGWKSSAGAAKQ